MQVQEVTHAPAHGPSSMNIPAPLSEFRRRTHEVGRERVACEIEEGEGVGFTKSYYTHMLLFQ